MRFFLCGLLLCWPWMSFQPSMSDDARWRLVLQCVLDSLAACHMTQKDAYRAMGIDKGDWSRMCARERHLPLNLLVRLPARFQLEFVSRYAFLVVRESAKEILEDVTRSA